MVNPGSPCSSMNSMAVPTMRCVLSGVRDDGGSAPATTAASASVPYSSSLRIASSCLTG